MKRLQILEMTLVLIAIATGTGAAVIGQETEQSETFGRIVEGRGSIDAYEGIQNVANSLDAGFDGGAVGLAIICAVALAMITWIEVSIAKMKLTK